MGIRGKAKTVLAVILSVVLLLGVVSWQKAQAQHKYTAEEVSNLVFNDALYLLRTVFVSSVFTQINNRRYQMDEIFNMVYDDVNHSLRVTVLADSAHEFRALWSDTVLARLYATKDGACIYFWMRGVHGDTIAKFEDRHHNIMATLDTTGEWKAYGYKFFVWTNANNPADSMKLWARHDTLFWNDAVGVPHAVYPVPAAPSAIMAFGDTNAYYASIASYGANRDSIGGYYFSGAGAIQAAINRASIAATSANRKTVYILEGTYLQPCTTKSYIRIVGMGKSNTILQFNDANRYYGGGHEFSVDNLTMELQQSGAGPFGLSVQGSDRVEYRNVDIISAVGNYVTLSSTAGDTILFDNCELYSRNPSNYCQIIDTIGGMDPYQQFIKCKIVGNAAAINIISTTGDQGTPGKIDFRECNLTSVNGYGVQVDPSYVSVYLLLNFYHSHVERASGGTYSLVMGQSTGYNEAHAYSSDFIGQVYAWGFANNLFWADGGCHIDTKGADYPIVTSVAGQTWPDTMGVVHWREGVKRQPYGMHNVAHDTIGGKPATPHEGWDAWTTRTGPNGDTLWVWSNSAWNNVWPAAVAPLPAGVGAFGDTNAYYVSKIFGPGRDSIGGYYYNTIQAAINQARTAGASATNKKTVYIFEGTYNEPCTLKNWVNIKGNGQLRTFLRFPHDSARFIVRGAANFTVEDVSILCHDWDGAGLAGVCSLSTASCSSVVYKNTTFSENEGTANFRFVISGVGSYSLTDSVTLDHCNVGGFSWNYGYYSPTNKNSSSLLVGPIVPAYTYLKNVNINMNSQSGPGGKFALKCSTSSSNIGLHMFIQDCRVAASATLTGTSYLGAFRCMTSGSGGYLEMLNSSFETDGQATVDTAFVLDDYGYGYGPFIEINNCMFKGLVGCSGNLNHIKTTGSTVASVVYPFFGNASFGGTFEWNQAGNVPSNYPTQPGWHFGEMYFDTTKTPTAYVNPHEGMEYFKSNAANDTLYLYANGAWRSVYPASAGIADSARYLYGGVSLPTANRITIGFSGKNLIDAAGNHTWDIGSITNAPDTVFCGAVVGASDLHLYSGGVVQMQGTVAAVGSQGTYGAAALDTQKFYGRTFFNSSAGFWSAIDTIQFGLSNDTLTLDSRKNSAFLDFRELTVLFKSGWMLFDQIKPATNDSASSSLGSASVPYAFAYISDGFYGDTFRSFSSKPMISRVRDSLIIQAWERKNGTRVATLDSLGKMVVSKATADTVDFLSTVAAGANAGTLTNSPVLGDPTVWIAIKVGGVTKYVPAW